MPVPARIVYVAFSMGTISAQAHTAWVMGALCRTMERRKRAGVSVTDSTIRIDDHELDMSAVRTSAAAGGAGGAGGGTTKSRHVQVETKTKTHRRAVLIDTTSTSMLIYDPESPTTAVQGDSDESVGTHVKSV
ncbi:hypothetical protein HDU93_002094 [Gonapodya sp. JEL0774]|nr:hypothetical protein HDU93_002094 [Gonapodya sp. JEL0774]